MTAAVAFLAAIILSAEVGAVTVEKKGPDTLMSLLNHTLLNTTDGHGCTLSTRISVSGISNVASSCANASSQHIGAFQYWTVENKTFVSMVFAGGSNCSAGGYANYTFVRFLCADVNSTTQSDTGACSNNYMNISTPLVCNINMASAPDAPQVSPSPSPSPPTTPSPSPSPSPLSASPSPSPTPSTSPSPPPNLPRNIGGARGQAMSSGVMTPTNALLVGVGVVCGLCCAAATLYYVIKGLANKRRVGMLFLDADLAISGFHANPLTSHYGSERGKGGGWAGSRAGDDGGGGRVSNGGRISVGDDGGRREDGGDEKGVAMSLLRQAADSASSSLPEGWTLVTDGEEQWYRNDVDGTLQWEKPTGGGCLPETLPDGWTLVTDGTEQWYRNDVDGTSQWEKPARRGDAGNDDDSAGRTAPPAQSVPLESAPLPDGWALVTVGTESWYRNNIDGTSQWEKPMKSSE